MAEQPTQARPHVQLCGGCHEVRPADSNIQNIADRVRLEAEQEANRQFPQFVATEYTAQVVAGMNYFIKVDTGSESIVLGVYRTLPHMGERLILHGVQWDVGSNPPAYFASPPS